MRLVLILHPGYSFPHPLESFPMDRHYLQWLNQHQENHLIIISSTLVIPPAQYAERIIVDQVPYNHRSSSLSSFQYIWKVMFHLKKHRADRIHFDGIDTLFFFSKNRWLSFVFRRVINKKFRIMRHVIDREPSALYNENMIDIPQLPSPVFESRKEISHDQVKEELTNGSEYFLCSAHFASAQQLTTLLKAYSLFKQRLKSNFKLVLTGIQPSNKQCLTLLSNYKFRQDVIIPSAGQFDSFSSVLLAAYAHVFSSSEMYYPCTPADCAAGRVPVLSPYNRSNDKDVSNEFTFKEGDVQDLAEKMMRIYKDEAARKQIIQSMYEYFRQQDQSFDFSASLPNAPL